MPINCGITFLQTLKYFAGSPVANLVIPIGSPIIAVLRPVATQPAFINPQDVRLLSEWRNRHVTSFLNEFIATNEQTTHWLMRTVGPLNTKILFMLDDCVGRTFGCMGIAYINWETSYGEVDTVIRGDAISPGIMTPALRALLAWGRAYLGIKNIKVRVRSDNLALTFYQKFGFTEEKRMPLKRTSFPGKIVWEECSRLSSDDDTPSPISLVYMSLS